VDQAKVEIVVNFRVESPLAGSHRLVSETAIGFCLYRRSLAADDLAGSENRYRKKARKNWVRFQRARTSRYRDLTEIANCGVSVTRSDRSIPRAGNETRPKACRPGCVQLCHHVTEKQDLWRL